MLLPLAWLWSSLLLLRQGDARYGARNHELHAHSFSAPLLYSRSLVLVIERRDAVTK